MPLSNFDRILGQISYPGDTPGESNLLRAWLREHGPKFDRIEWDVRMGEGATPPPDLAEDAALQMRRGTMLRADCIVWTGDYATIVEVKKRGLPNAMGQLHAYRMLYLGMHPQLPPPYMALVTASISDEVISIMDAYSIQVYIVEPMEPLR